MEIVYSIFIGIIVGMIASKIAGLGLQCRRDTARCEVQKHKPTTANAPLKIRSSSAFHFCVGF